MKKSNIKLLKIIILVISISLIVFGTITVVLQTRRTREIKNLIKYQELFQNALDKYLNAHPEVINETKNNLNDVTVSLEQLKNEKLIPSDLEINYNDNYYRLNYSLLSDEKNLNIVEVNDCEKVEIKSIANWWKETDSFKDYVAYFCPKTASSGNDGCDETLDCSKCNSATQIIDPKVACDNNILNQNTLACEILKNNTSSTTNFKSINDDYGKSYYFTGNVSNNYVKFNNVVWRIVRIQGDGSVKLIKNEPIPPDINNGKTYKGKWLTYGTMASYPAPVNNVTGGSYPGILDYDIGNGCWVLGTQTTEGYDSTFYSVDTNNTGSSKKYDSLKNILNDYISNFDENVLSKLKKEKICLGMTENQYSSFFDTTLNLDYNIKLEDLSVLSLECKGKKKSNSTYIAPITVDEAVLAGAKSSSYLREITNNSYYTITISSLSRVADVLTRGYGYVFSINKSDAVAGISSLYAGTKCINDDETDNNGKKIDYNIEVIPTIVLKADINVSKGEGTEEEPYVIS